MSFSFLNLCGYNNIQKTGWFINSRNSFLTSGFFAGTFWCSYLTENGCGKVNKKNQACAFYPLISL